MIVQKTYKVTNKQQLIDLNQNSINFDITFTAKSKNKETYEIVIVDQATLDSEVPNLQYKKATNGEISGNIINDKNIYQNHFIIIKAEEKDCEVDIIIDKKEIPVSVQPQQVEPQQVEAQQLQAQQLQAQQLQAQQLQAQQLQAQQLQAQQLQDQQLQDQHPVKSNWVLYLILFIAILGIIYYFYSKSNIKLDETLVDIVPDNTILQTTTPDISYDAETVNMLNNLEI